MSAAGPVDEAEAGGQYAHDDGRVCELRRYGDGSAAWYVYADPEPLDGHPVCSRAHE